MSNKIGVRQHLRLAVRKLDARGLQLASKWACEQLVGMDSDETLVSDSSGYSFSQFDSNDNEIVSEKEQDLLLFARSLLTNGEYQRCAHLLRRSTKGSICSEIDSRDSRHPNSISVTTKAMSKLLTNGAVKSKLGLFLSVYSMYMAGEKLKEQLQATDNVNDGAIFPGMVSSGGAVNEKQSNGEGQSSDAKSAKVASANLKNANFDGDIKKNPFLNEIFAELSPLYRDKHMDGFLLYLFAVVVRDLVKQGQMQGQGGVGGLSLFPSANSGGRASSHDNFQAASSGGLSAYYLFTESLREYPWNW
jgi:Anaphase promoting complex subunit 8 / Cdc23